MAGQVAHWWAMSSLILVAMLVAGVARAHEVQPAVADLTIAPDRAELTIEMTLEAPLAGIDLDGLTDTNDAGQTDEYDRLRALPPQQLETALRAAWPELAAQITILAGETRLSPELTAVEAGQIGDVELGRTSTITLGIDLPPDGSDLVVGWDAALGGVVIREVVPKGAEGYTAYLTSGALTATIPRSGGHASGALETALNYLVIGFEHIIPKGLDHILFVLGLFFLSLQMRPLLMQVTAFTVAHTVTLALGILGIVTVPASIVEPLIALSIVYVGVENVLSRGLTPWRPVIVFLFGLLHGLGFASVLGDIGLNPAQFVVGLISFNVGVELGQLSVILAAFLLVGIWFRGKPWYKTRVANPASILIALVGAWWAFERIFL